MNQRNRFGIRPGLAVTVGAVVIAGIVAGLTAIPIYDALVPVHRTSPAGQLMLALTIVLLASLVWIAAMLSFRPLGERIKGLVDDVSRRDEAIDSHELMERNLQVWMRERKLYELELKEARLSAEDAFQIKTQFLATISHELRTPLHTILSYARFGINDATNSKFDDAAEYFEVIFDSGDYLALLLKDLLDLSRLESGKMSFDVSPTSFGDIVGCVLEQSQLSLSEKKLNIVANLKDPDIVVVDSSRVMQVIRNVIDNAINYAPAGSSIFVDVKPEDDKVTLCIRDRGKGVPDDELSEIFERFKQSREAKRTEGAGLGLAISKQIVTCQDGRIWAENHPEGGLAVFVQFDACEGERPDESRVSDATGVQTVAADRTPRKEESNVH